MYRSLHTTQSAAQSAAVPLVLLFGALCHSAYRSPQGTLLRVDHCPETVICGATLKTQNIILSISTHYSKCVRMRDEHSM